MEPNNIKEVEEAKVSTQYSSVQKEETKTSTQYSILGILNNERLPKWALGVSVIILLLTIILSDLNIGTLLQNKLNSDTQIALQIQTNKSESETAVIDAISELNKDLNDRLSDVLTAYNEQTKINVGLLDSNSKLVQEVAALKYEAKERQEIINSIQASNAELQAQIDQLKLERDHLNDQLKVLTLRVENLIKNGGAK